MTIPYKLHVKSGAFEFSAEGPEKSVKDDFEKFRRDFLSREESNAVTEEKQPKTDQSRKSEAGIGSHGKQPANNSGKVPIDPLHDKTFLCDESGVSLRTLPNTGDKQDQDSLLLLIYGIQVLKNQRQAGSVELGKAIRQSGIKIDRLSVSLNALDSFVQKGGQRRSTRYVLNNQGIIKAKEIMQKMFPA